jgi:hypothetical protein
VARFRTIKHDVMIFLFTLASKASIRFLVVRESWYLEVEYMETKQACNIGYKILRSGE